MNLTQDTGNKFEIFVFGFNKAYIRKTISILKPYTSCMYRELASIFYLLLLLFSKCLFIYNLQNRCNLIYLNV